MTAFHLAAGRPFDPAAGRLAWALRAMSGGRGRHHHHHRGPGFGPGPEPPAERLVCMQFPDGSGMAGPVPAGWQPPNLLDGDLAETSEESRVPVTLIVLAVGAALLIGVSVLAFRREPAA